MENKLSPEEREATRRKANKCLIIIIWLAAIALTTGKLITDYYNR